VTRLFAATGRDVFRLEDDGSRWTAHPALTGSGARCVAARGDTIVVGTPSGVAVSDDGGDGWWDAELPERDVFAVAVGPEGAVYAGTEPSRLFRMRARSSGWEPLDSLLELPSQPTWSFPPRPWTSHVRWIAPSPHDGRLLLVGIELGGLMRSEDGGETWEDHRPGAQRDVHSLAWHPSVPGRAYEAAGGGAAWSFDAGETWEPADAGRDRHYAWAVAVDAADPEVWFVSASTGPFAAHGRGDPQARIYRWRGEGPWQPLAGGLPEPLEAMPYALTAADGRLFAGLAGGRLFETRDQGDSWTELDVGLSALVALAVA
jgi:photosystem II stability/assembly factor-like uncharacterized protein